MLLRRQVMETRTKHARQFIPNFYMLGARRTGMCLIGINLKKKEALLISEAIVTTEKKLSYSIPIFN
jgi:hypothetical protein